MPLSSREVQPCVVLLGFWRVSYSDLSMSKGKKEKLKLNKLSSLVSSCLTRQMELCGTDCHCVVSVFMRLYMACT